ncbi:uncharacterized protein LOC126764617 [Bactrocera neohumeralis]|uniref:uncharacterized protein LOC126764617 n=1 Tax=Bactrocera neohumeralis TaxID=98809 RepID=UPI0021659AB5|nr:uncharacterized protein LOC126764617 [Bactrocera neohumeralis]
MLAHAWEQLSPVVVEKCWHPLLKDDVFNEEGANCSEDDDIPLSVLRSNTIQQQSTEYAEINNLLESIVPEVTFNTADLVAWVSTDDPIEDWNIVDDVAVLSSEEDEEPNEKCNITASEAVSVFDKAIEWAEEYTNSLPKIMVLKNFREEAVKQCLKAKKKQTKIVNFFQQNKVLLSYFVNVQR